MMYPTHVVFGMACYMAASRVLGLPNEGLEIAAAAVGALLPDFDSPRTYLGRRLKIISVPLYHLIGHRTWSHSVTAALLFAGLVAYASSSNVALVSGLGIGYLSHVLGDWLTPHGIPFLWPLREERYASPLPFRTGGVTEQTVFGLLVLGLLWAWGILPLHRLAGFGG